MELKLDSDVQAVAEYMQRIIPAGKLISVAEQLPKLAELLWSRYEQEPCIALTLQEFPITNGLPQDANVSGLGIACVDGGSAVEAGTQ